MKRASLFLVVLLAMASVAFGETLEKNIHFGEWLGQIHVDEMDGSKRYVLRLPSKNTKEVARGDSHLVLYITKDAKKEAEMGIFLPGAAFDGYDYSQGRIKFGNENVEYFNLYDGLEGTAYLGTLKDFIKSFRSHDNMMIEVPIFDTGPKVFKFDLKGANEILDWYKTKN